MKEKICIVTLYEAMMLKEALASEAVKLQEKRFLKKDAQLKLVTRIIDSRKKVYDKDNVFLVKKTRNASMKFESEKEMHLNALDEMKDEMKEVVDNFRATQLTVDYVITKLDKRMNEVILTVVESGQAKKGYEHAMQLDRYTKLRKRNDASRKKANRYTLPWTEAEINYLQRNFGRKPVDEIAEKLGRTISGVYNAVYRHGVSGRGAANGSN